MTKRVAVIVDDEPANRDFLVRLIQQAGFESHGAGSGEEAKSIAASVETPILFIIDSQLPDIEGTELAISFRELYPNAKLIMATMLDDLHVIERAFKNGCDAFLVKPHGFMELFKRIQLNMDEIENLIFDKYGVRTYRPSSA